MLLNESSLSNQENTSQLKSFSIYGLFGYKNITIPFAKQTIILIAENGAGKTTILNALYYTLSKQFEKLKQIDYQSIKIKCLSGEIINIPNINLLEIKNEKIVKQKQLQEIKIEIAKRRLARGSVLVEYRKILDKIQNSIQNISQIENEISKNIEQFIRHPILYYPTYRRIEEDLKSLGYEDLNLEGSDTKLIQFGMEDVTRNFERIKTQIKDSAFESFSKVTGEMLTQFIEGIDITQEMKASIQPEILNIILSRVGEKNISKTEQEKIKALVQSGEINQNAKYNDLVYFLSKLINLYKQQQKFDEAIKKFREVCNKYLENKKIIYEDATAEIYIQQTRNDEPIELSKLSSGEKQIISLFSRVYLESSNDFILIFDEPELSLSVEWQRMLLPDILKSGKCKLLIAATHSPFIFDNELDANAYDLDDFMSEG